MDALIRAAYDYTTQEQDTRRKKKRRMDYSTVETDFVIPPAADKGSGPSNVTGDVTAATRATTATTATTETTVTTATTVQDVVDWRKHAATVVDNAFIASMLSRDRHVDVPHDHVRQTIVPVTRAYEESFLCAPHQPEHRPCVKGDACEGLHLQYTGSHGFVLREFLLPGEDPPQEPGMCLLCTRCSVMEVYNTIRASNGSCHPDMVISRHWNLTGVAGEYRREDCIVSDSTYYEGLIEPIALHSRNNYRSIRRDGIDYLEVPGPSSLGDQTNRSTPTASAPTRCNTSATTSTAATASSTSSRIATALSIHRATAPAAGTRDPTLPPTTPPTGTSWGASGH